MMGVTISVDSDNLVVITITGVFSYQDLQTIQDASKKGTRPAGKVNCLILASQLSGWGKDGDWGDLTFMYENDPLIGKIAVVSEEKRKDELLMFLGAGRRGAEVEFFFPDEEEDAREWLAGEIV